MKTEERVRQVAVNDLAAAVDRLVAVGLEELPDDARARVRSGFAAGCCLEIFIRAGGDGKLQAIIATVAHPVNDQRVELFQVAFEEAASAALN